MIHIQQDNVTDFEKYLAPLLSKAIPTETNYVPTNSYTCPTNLYGVPTISVVSPLFDSEQAKHLHDTFSTPSYEL